MILRVVENVGQELKDRQVKQLGYSFFFKYIYIALKNLSLKTLKFFFLRLQMLKNLLLKKKLTIMSICSLRISPRKQKHQAVKTSKIIEEKIKPRIWELKLKKNFKFTCSLLSWRECCNELNSSEPMASKRTRPIELSKKDGARH